MSILRFKSLWVKALVGSLALGVVIVGVVWAARSQRDHAPGAARKSGPEPKQAGETAVQAIHPKQDPTFVISVQQLASVEPFYQADLRSCVAGLVKYVQKDIGDRVSAGELLVQIDVPDLLEEVGLKESVIVQRQKDLRLARVQVKFAKAAIELADNNIEQKQADARQAEATRDLRKIRLERFIKLRDEKTINEIIVDEENRDYLAAEAAWESAKIAIKKARADRAEKIANQETAMADLELKQTLVEVARKDRNRVQALVNYAKIRAPFDGVITRRTVDLGSFVQNSTTAHTEPLISIARSDIVTVVMRVPDNDAPFVTLNTEAQIQIDDLPGTVICGKVTRFSPTIRESDRTMRVEVDLFNGTKQEYRTFVKDGVAAFLTPLGACGFLDGMTLLASTRSVLGRNAKGGADAFPLFPEIIGRELGERHLLPGRSGTMRLLLQKFQDSYLLPSSAIFTKGGKPYLWEVIDGVAHRVPVRVQLNDGRKAKVVVIVNEGNLKYGKPEVVEELTGEEKIIFGRQAELSEGQPVECTLVDW